MSQYTMREEDLNQIVIYSYLTILGLHRRFLFGKETMKNDINHLKHAFSTRRELITLLA
jgi:hypothetical protein